MRVLFTVSLFAAASATAAPTTLVHQGRLLDAAGTPLSGPRTLTFLIEDGAGATVWSGTLPVVLEDGYYSVVLGSLGDLDDAVFPPGATRRLQVMDGATALGGPVDLHPVPYAVSATHVRDGLVAPGRLDLPAADTRPCDATTRGAMRYNPTLDAPEFCSESGWTAFGVTRRASLDITAPTTFTGGVFTPGRTVADGVAYRVAPPADGASTVSRFDATDDLSAGFAPGDLALVINLQGAPGDTADVGSHELVTIEQATPSALTFTTPLTASYDGTVPGQQKVVIQRIPTYDDVSIAAGASLSAAAWDGLASKPYRTGILALRVTGTLAIAPTGRLSADGAGFRGGAGSASGYCQWGYNGEGMDQPSRALQGVANTGGGQGGGSTGSWCVGAAEHKPMSGGGGSYGTAGAGGFTSSAGAVYGDAALDRLFLGSGGGGSTSYRHSSGSGYGGAGGAGGGIVYVIANTIVNNGTLSADGADGANGVTHGGGGGGGSGGSVHLFAERYEGNPVSVAGGSGGSGYLGIAGGSGGAGRAVIE